MTQSVSIPASRRAGAAPVKGKTNAKKPYAQSAALLKEAGAKRGPREAWIRLQKALAWLHLEDVAELDDPGGRLTHPVRIAVFTGIKEVARKHKGSIPYLLGLSLFSEGQDHDFLHLLAEIDRGFVPEVNGRWTDRFLAAPPPSGPEAVHAALRIPSDVS